MFFSIRCSFTSIMCLAAWVVLLSGYFLTAADSDFEVRMQRGLYFHEIRAEYERAIPIFREIVSSENLDEDLRAQAYFRVVDCLLSLHRVEDAKEVFREFYSKFPSTHYWLNRSLERVPSEFLMKDLPWVDEEQLLYRWFRNNGDTIGYALLHTSLVERDGVKYWRLDSRMLGASHRHFQVDFEVGSLEPSFSFYRLRRLDSFEAFVFSELIPGDPIDVESGWDHESVGMQMTQFPFSLGFSSQQSLFKPSEGMSLLGTMDVSAVESIEHNGDHIGCFRVNLELDGADQDYWFENNESRRLVKYQVGELNGELVHVDFELQEDVFQISGLRGKCEDGWYPIRMGSEDLPAVVFIPREQTKGLVIKQFDSMDELNSDIEHCKEFLQQEGYLFLSATEVVQLGFESERFVVGRADVHSVGRVAVVGSLSVGSRFILFLGICDDSELASVAQDMNKILVSLEVIES